MSHPVWVRGLKLIFHRYIAQAVLVAPRVGAWIETTIEGVNLLSLSSHPVWVRGLKHSRKGRSIQGSGVAPRVGAWIETSLLGNFFTPVGVAPRVGAWIETLFQNSAILWPLRSHPVWVRGLKPVVKLFGSDTTGVAPRVGAWIETISSCCPSKAKIVAPRVGAWIETWTFHSDRDFWTVAPRVGAWIETQEMQTLHLLLRRRTPCGCVD